MMLEELCKKAIKKRKLVDYLRARGEYFSSPWDLQFDVENVLKEYYFKLATIEEKQYIEHVLCKLIISKDESEKKVGYSAVVSLGLNLAMQYLIEDFKKKVFEKFRLIDVKINFINALMFFKLIDAEKIKYFEKQYQGLLAKHGNTPLLGSELVLKNTYERLLYGKRNNEEIIKDIREQIGLGGGKHYKAINGKVIKMDNNGTERPKGSDLHFRN